MADATFENALKAMRIAHDKGDMESARKMARLAKTLQAEAEVQASVEEGDGFTAQMNKSIAEGIGGLVDFVNPFDEYTGSATTGLKNLMAAGGVRVAEGEAEGFVENLGAGIGSAAAAAVPVAKGVQALQAAPSLIGQVARTVSPQLATTGGFAAELAAGGAAATAAEEAERRGYGETAQQIAGLAGGLTPAAVGPALRTAGRGAAAVARSTPFLGTGISATAGAVAPFTQAGARRLAGERVRELAGGRERAIEVAGRIRSGDTELGLTPAEQTNEARLIELQRAAMQQDPKVAEAISQRQFEAETTAREGLEFGGRVEDAQAFVAQRQAEFSDTLDNYIAAARASAQKKIPTSETDSIKASNIVADELRRAEKVAKANQKMLWDKIPDEVEMDVSGIRSTIQSLAEGATRIGRKNIPAEATSFLKATAAQGTDRVKEVNSLYTAMRDTARNAVSGDKVNRDQARIANQIADSILASLDDIRPDTDVNRAIVEARTFSRQMHDKFSKGTAGKLLKRTVRGEEATPRELTLQSTIGAGGDKGFLAQQDILAAVRSAPDTGEATNATANYLRNIFNEKVFTGDQFSRSAAENFLTTNKRLLDEFPNVRSEIEQSISSQQRVKDVTDRGADLSKSIKESTSAKFAASNPERAIDAVISAPNPTKAMANLIASAKKDKTGAALEGVKRAISKALISRSTRVLEVAGEAGATSELRGTRLSEALSDEVLGGIAQQALSKGEMSRLRIISKELEKLDKARVLSSTGNTMAMFKPNVISSVAGRILAARYGAQLGGGLGGSLQSAQIASGRVQQFLENITNAKAQRLLIDAVQDPDIMKDLLLDVSNPKNFARIEKTMTPYIVGAIAGTEEQ